MDYVSGEPRPDGVEVSEAAFVPLGELRTSKDSAPFTRAIIPKLPRKSGLRLDRYAPPPGPTATPPAFFLDLCGAKGFSRPVAPRLLADPLLLAPLTTELPP